MAGTKKSGLPWLRSRKSKILFCVAGLIFSLAFVFWSTELELSDFLPDAGRLDELNRELKDARTAYRTLADRNKEVDSVNTRYNEALATYWQNAKNGDPEIEVRSLLENKAKEAGFKFTDIGSMRKSRVNNDIYAIEIDMSAQAELAKLTDFLVRMDTVSPAVYWKRIELRVDPRHSDGMVNFSAVMRIPACEEEVQK